MKWWPHCQVLAMREGWGIFKRDFGRYFEIQRDDQFKKFDSDEAATLHVIARAEAGDELAIEALRIVTVSRLTS